MKCMTVPPVVIAKMLLSHALFKKVLETIVIVVVMHLCFKFFCRIFTVQYKISNCGFSILIIVFKNVF